MRHKEYKLKSNPGTVVSVSERLYQSAYELYFGLFGNHEGALTDGRERMPIDITLMLLNALDLNGTQVINTVRFIGDKDIGKDILWVGVARAKNAKFPSAYKTETDLTEIMKLLLPEARAEYDRLHNDALYTHSDDLGFNIK